MNISGKVKLINETKEYGSNGFRKREIVLTTQEQYPQNILVEFIQDRTDLLDAYNIGDFVKIDINLRGREWTNDKGEVNILILFRVGVLKKLKMNLNLSYHHYQQRKT